MINPNLKKFSLFSFEIDHDSLSQSSFQAFHWMRAYAQIAILLHQQLSFSATLWNFTVSFNTVVLV